MSRARMKAKAVRLAASLLAVGGSFLDGAPARAARPGVSARKAAGKALGAVAVDRGKIPEGGPTPKLALPRPERFQLKNGTRVVVVERHELPMLSMAVVWPSGAGDEAPAKAGLALLCSSLLDEGTKKHGALALGEEVEGLGAQLSTGATWDLTVVSMNTLKRNLGPALGLLAEVAAEPAFDEKEFERVRGETLASLVQRKDQASVVAQDVYGRVLYGTEARYGLPAIGTEETLRGLARTDVVSFYEDVLRPERATIIVAGDTNVATLRPLLESAFADWKGKPAKTDAAKADPGKTVSTALVSARPRRVLVDKPGAPQSEIRLGLPSVPRASPDFFPLTVMNEIFGGGEFSNRLNLNLREAHAYTYGAHSAFAFRRDGGPFVAAAATKTAVTGAATMEAFGELLRIRSVPVDDRELRFAKDGLERAMARRFESISEVAGELAAQVVYGLPDDYFATFRDRVEAVTVADVQRVAAARLDPTKLSIVIVGDRKTVEPQLKELPVGAFENLDAK